MESPESTPENVLPELTPVAVSTGPEGAGRPPALDPEQLDAVVRMKAQGMPDRQIALAYGVSGHTIARHLKSPAAQEKLAFWREIIRNAVLRGIAEGGMEQGFKVLKEAADNGDSKGFDAAARGLMNMEKTAASAAGEARKLEVGGQGGGPLQLDVRALIAQIVEHNS